MDILVSVVIVATIMALIRARKFDDNFYGKGIKGIINLLKMRKKDEPQDEVVDPGSHTPNFLKAKEGDTAFHITYGFVVICRVWDDLKGYTSISIRPPGGKIDTSILYGMDGRYRADDAHPTVFECHRQAKKYFDEVWVMADKELRDTLRGVRYDD